MNMFGLEVDAVSTVEIERVRNNLVRINPYKINIIPFLTENKLYIKTSVGIFRLSVTNRVCDLLPMSIYVPSKELL